MASLAMTWLWPVFLNCLLPQWCQNISSNNSHCSTHTVPHCPPITILPLTHGQHASRSLANMRIRQNLLNTLPSLTESLSSKWLPLPPLQHQLNISIVPSTVCVASVMLPRTISNHFHLYINAFSQHVLLLITWQLADNWYKNNTL